MNRLTPTESEEYSIYAAIRLLIRVFFYITITLPLRILRETCHFLGLDAFPSGIGRDRTRNSPMPKSPESHTSEAKQKFIEKIVNSRDIIDLVEAHGYRLHEHVVQTQDGYLLTIHRLFSPSSSASEPDMYPKPVVYFHHGLLTNSELFVLGETTEKCLPFLLLKRGYDVWLGNNRGNKYSRKHVSRRANDKQFWNFSLDEYALYDIPNSVDYILQATGESLVTYVGFSQGSAQALAALSLSPALNKKINLFVGLSPAMVPRNLNHPLLKNIVNLAPRFLFLAFGKRAIVPSVIFWQKLFGPKLYEQVVDKSLTVLFGWKSQNISPAQKLMGYTHMFSPSSVKSVVHWFQIIKTRRFQMYDEGGNAGSLLTSLTLESTFSKNHRVAPFPVQNITTRIMLVYGKSDILVDIDSSMANLTPRELEVLGVDGYEHMDTLWGENVELLVFEPILEKIASCVEGIHGSYISSETLVTMVGDHELASGTLLTKEVKQERQIRRVIETLEKGDDLFV
ncbi:hypothetical protein BABINDRAFT_163613 [Babjeviella inositovora NRRL Y-12698]|uniref:AB hydrolase-1 domain-containing protein n=1 Tax=Babjeviella inositovora NRRL Y-12698 TaxID=984486 RepID=A0A1E3QI34_9ASCO|nr:uncharacterized protein BABINDRAFT_163613 [Babjeviella inositovora NRRL Y-12698]ODQ77356.1 hypothetical protein BABINDRAFT_163613 [Babjeviella inositovora NRRL Y-12698]